MIDSTMIRAHHAAAKGGSSIRHQVVPEGDLPQKYMRFCDALGNPMRFILTGGEKNNCRQGLDLLDGLSREAVLADKGYNADCIVEAAKNMNAMAVISPRSNRIVQREYNKHL